MLGCLEIQYGHKQLGMERTTTYSLVPFQPFQPGRMKLRHPSRGHGLTYQLPGTRYTSVAGQDMAVSRGCCRGRVLWRPHMPHPMLSMPSHAISCTPIPPWSSSKCRNTPSTNQLHVFAFQVGRSVWLNKDYCLNTCYSSSKFFRQGGNAWNLFDFDNQSAAIFC